MRAGEAASAAGVSVKALRYYETAGLLAPARLGNGYRDYTDLDVRLVGEIRALMALGLSPGETRPFLDCLLAGHEIADDCPESLAAYQDKIDRIDALVARLTRTRSELADRLQHAARRGFRFAGPAAPGPAAPAADPLPDDLPVPADDGAADHLPGRILPPLTFTGSHGEPIQLNEVASGRWVLFLYPLTGEPGVDLPRGWDEIPGARGCSQEACSFRDSVQALRDLGVERVLALSSDRPEYQQDLARRLHLPYPLLSDPGLSLAAALDLPTFDALGATLYKRLTLIVQGDRVERVFYPVFPPDAHAEEVVAWLNEQTRAGGVGTDVV